MSATSIESCNVLHTNWGSWPGVLVTTLFGRKFLHPAGFRCHCRSQYNCTVSVNKLQGINDPQQVFLCGWRWRWSVISQHTLGVALCGILKCCPIMTWITLHQMYYISPVVWNFCHVWACLVSLTCLIHASIILWKQFAVISKNDQHLIA